MRSAWRTLGLWPQAVAACPRGSGRSRAFSGRDWEAEPGAEEIIRAEKRKLKAIKFRRTKAEFGLSGAPPRTLMSEALRQIRFLNAKFPEEWRMSDLAEGFSVNEDVIRRVLRSKFTPSLQRRMKQDAKADAMMLTHSHGAKQPTANLPSVKVLAQVRVKSKPIPDQARLPRLSQGTVTLTAHSDLNGRAQKRSGKETGRIDPVQQRLCSKLTVQSSPDVVKARTGRKVANRKEREECEETCAPSDREQLPGVPGTDEEWEKLAESGVDNQMKVVQKGSEFYDQDGNFLYRISNMHPFNNPKQET